MTTELNKGIKSRIQLENQISKDYRAHDQPHAEAEAGGRRRDARFTSLLPTNPEGKDPLRKQGSDRVLPSPKSGSHQVFREDKQDSMQVIQKKGNEKIGAFGNVLTQLKPPVKLEPWNSPISNKSNNGRAILQMNSSFTSKTGKKVEKPDTTKANKELKKELANMNFALTELMDMNDDLLRKVNALEKDQK